MKRARCPWPAPQSCQVSLGSREPLPLPAPLPGHPARRRKKGEQGAWSRQDPGARSGDGTHLEREARGGDVKVGIGDELADRLDQLLEEASLCEARFEHCVGDWFPARGCWRVFYGASFNRARLTARRNGKKMWFLVAVFGMNAHL